MFITAVAVFKYTKTSCWSWRRILGRPTSSLHSSLHGSTAARVVHRRVLGRRPMLGLSRSEFSGGHSRDQPIPLGWSWLVLVGSDNRSSVGKFSTISKGCNTFRKSAETEFPLRRKYFSPSRSFLISAGRTSIILFPDRVSLNVTT